MSVGSEQANSLFYFHHTTKLLLTCLVCEGTQLEGSRLIIEEIPIIVFCPECETETPPVATNNLCCPKCETPTPQIVRGREMEVTALEIE